MADPTFPCTIYFLSDGRGVSQTATALSETSRTYRIKDADGKPNSVPKEKREGDTWHRRTVRWTADREEARAHDMRHLDVIAERHQKEIDRLEADLKTYRGYLGAVTRRRAKWNDLGDEAAGGEVRS